MPAKLYVVHGSHPCKTVERALELKGIAYKKVEFPPPSHALAMKLLFGGRTVPGIRFEDGEKVQGSRAILARLEELVPDPPLLPAEPELRQKVLEAERWGEEVLQADVRKILWPTLAANAQHSPSFMEGAKVPTPAPVLKASIPLIAKVEYKMNATSPAIRDERLRVLPGHLDKVDAWVEEGVLGAPTPNRADLQIGPSLGLLATMEDVADLMQGRPCGQLAARYPSNGKVPRGAVAVPVTA